MSQEEWTSYWQVTHLVDSFIAFLLVKRAKWLNVMNNAVISLGNSKKQEYHQAADVIQNRRTKLSGKIQDSFSASHF